MDQRVHADESVAATNTTLSASSVTIAALDDDPIICKLLETYVTTAGYGIRLVPDRFKLAALVEKQCVDLILLDISLPGDDGIDIARSIRLKSTIPIIMLTSRDSTSDKVVGLDAGADDYITKPIEPDELIARIRALLRRSRYNEQDNNTQSARQVEFADLTLDIRTKLLSRQDETSRPLTTREQDLLLALLRHAGEIRSRDQLCRQVNGRPWDPSDRSLDVHLANLRKKLRVLGADENLIETVRSQGFRIHAQPVWSN